MTDHEFFTECFHYGNFSQQEAIPTIHTQGFSLVDFSHKPPPSDDHHASDDDDDDVFDTLYPHGVPPPRYRRHIGNVPQIRNGDRVKVVLLPNQQGVWVKVWSYTAFDIVTGHIIDSVEHQTAIARGDLIAFPVTKVLGVKHGTNWG